MYLMRLAIPLSGLLLISCSKSDDGPAIPPPVDRGVDAQYTIILSENDELSSRSVTADALEIISLTEGTAFGPYALPELTYREGDSFSFLHRQPDCSATLDYWATGSSATAQELVFQEDGNCDIKVLALAHSGMMAYIAYSIPGDGIKELHYYLRTVSLGSGSPDFSEVELQKAPVALHWSKGRLFIHTFDSSDGKNSLLVLDAGTGDVINELDLGPDVLKLLKNQQGNLLIGYSGRHLVIEALSLETISRVNYEAGKEPEFAVSESIFFDSAGTLYYAMPTMQDNTEYPTIPGVYDFGLHTVYLYYFENFLSPDQRALYDISDTKVVALDHHNGLILIGYQKSGTSGEGGLLRIKPIPEPKFIDHLDLDGVPESIVVH